VAQERQLIVLDRSQSFNAVMDEQFESRGRLHIRHSHTRLQSAQPHPLGGLLEVKEGKIGYDPAGTSE
jgi:hypothetical protein